MAFANRRFKLVIWGLTLGYFVAYAPYSALIKVATTGLWPGLGENVSGFRLLPAALISTAITLPVIIRLMGWWKYAGRRVIFGVRVPFPEPLVFLSGLGTAIIIGATTLAFTFTGVSIVFALVLMRAGVLGIAPAVDRLFRRRVRWFSWTALGLSVAALCVALMDVNNYRLTNVAWLTIAAYLVGYLLRLPCINGLAKTNDTAVTRKYFVEEVMVAMPLLVIVPAAFALAGGGEIASELRAGFTNFFTSGVTLPALIIGALYSCLYCFGTLIYLDCRENTFCIPLNRCASLLAGVCASFVLTLFLNQDPPSAAQLGSAGLIVVALLVLSPLHHVQRSWASLKSSLASAYRMALDFAGGFGKQKPLAEPGLQEMLAGRLPAARAGREQLDGLRQIFLFVCSGNTCRSPIAANIGNAEIAARLKIPFEELGSARVQAQSAGLSARVGAPMMPEAQEALRLLDVPLLPHSARSLTVDLAHEVERIFCMTEAHRTAVVRLFPAAAAKTHCLDPAGDIEDPIGKGLGAYLSCARRIHTLVRSRLDELSLQDS
jgi:protein-tyrosine-phosphatase